MEFEAVGKVKQRHKEKNYTLYIILQMTVQLSCF